MDIGPKCYTAAPSAQRHLTGGAPSGTRCSVTSEPAGGPDVPESDVDRRRLERVIPDIIKRLLEAGLERLSEGPDSVRRVMSDLRLPREALGAIWSQIDETKTGVYRVVAKEVRDFLEQTSFAEEITRALTALSFEIRTEVRFVPNDAKGRPSPDVRSKVSVKRRSSSPPAAADDTMKDPGDAARAGESNEETK
jgi:hypothetical protein